MWLSSGHLGGKQTFPKHRWRSWTGLSQWLYPSVLLGWPFHMVSWRGWVRSWAGPIVCFPHHLDSESPLLLTAWFLPAWLLGHWVPSLRDWDLPWLSSSNTHQPTHCFTTWTWTPPPPFFYNWHGIQTYFPQIPNQPPPRSLPSKLPLHRHSKIMNAVLLWALPWLPVHQE